MTQSPTWLLWQLNMAPEFLYKAMDLLNDADLNYRTASNKQFLVELTLIKLCQAVGPSLNKNDAGEGQLRPITSSGDASQQQKTGHPTTGGSTRPQEPVRQHVAVKPKPEMHALSKPASISRPGGRMGGLNVPGLSLKGGIKHEETKVSESTQPYEKRKQAFTDAQFSTAWKEIMDKYPTEHLMVNAMRISDPQRSNDTTITAVVESEAIRDSLIASSQIIVSELRNRLANDFISFEVRLNKEKATVTSLIDAEAFAVMRKNHPYFNKFIDDFHLTLI